MANLQTILQDLGLSDNEARAYLASLELGAANIQAIADKSGVKRTTIYSLVDNLKNQGLLAEYRKGSKTFLAASDPSRLESLFKEKQEKLQNALPEFRSLYNLSPTKPKVRFYEGQEGIKAVYQDTLEEGKEIKCLVGWQSMVKAMPDYWSFYIAERVKRDIWVRALADRSPESATYQAQGEKELRELRLLPEGTSPFQTEVNIYGDKVAMLTFGQELSGVIIESKDIADTWRMVFEMIWNSVKQ
jgi:sugar-specific transcriptional regulator TrmB